MVPPGKVQIPGFLDTDSHTDVIRKGAAGLGVHVSQDHLSLLVSNALLKDVLPSGKPWTLGNYTAEFGGIQVRGKHTFGIYVPYYREDETDEV